MTLKRLGYPFWVAALITGFAERSADASLHLMQIEQVIGGVTGDTSAQAIQLRMRAIGQNLLEPARIRAWDAQGENPIVIIDFPTSVPNALPGTRILVTSKSFSAHTDPEAVPDFFMDGTIPESYLTAGSLTYEQTAPNIVYWRLSWGGGAYTGDTTGDSTNDDDPGLDPADFGPPFPGPLPSDCSQGLVFAGPASALSSSNDVDYSLSFGPAVFTNNSGVSFGVFVADSCFEDSDCDDGNGCTTDACVGGCCQRMNNTAPCDDGLFCTLTDHCTGGFCIGGGNRCPPDSVACTLDGCDETANQCTHTPEPGLCQNGLFCDGAEVCDELQGCMDAADPCVSPLYCDEPGDRCVICQNDDHCDDELFCNGAETCNTASGTCAMGANPCPPDQVACTVDFCDEAANACVHLPDHGPCANGIYCDGVEVCDALQGCIDGPDPCHPPLQCDELGGRCVDCLGDDQCDDGHFCNGLETCNTFSGACELQVDPCPPDIVGCTVDLCDEAADQCLHLADSGLCANGLFCDGMEICDPVQGCMDGADPCTPPLQCDEAGDRCVLCLADPQCDDELYCNGVETCNAVTGLCVGGVNPCPADSVACSVDSCDEDTHTCVHAPNDAVCQNGLFCDGMEDCDPLLGCIDGPNPCIPPLKCDEAGNRCVQCLNNSQCLDMQFCNGMESCDQAAGICRSGGNPCPFHLTCDEQLDQCVPPAPAVSLAGVGGMLLLLGGAASWVLRARRLRCRG